jgi:hypothetical protein
MATKDEMRTALKELVEVIVGMRIMKERSIKDEKKEEGKRNYLK